MRRPLRSLLLVLVFAAGCGPTRIPPPPAAFDTVVLTSSFTANKLYAEALAAFVRNNWESVPDETGGLTLLIVPDGSPVDLDAPDLFVRIVVEPLVPETGEPAPANPDLEDPEYGGPDLARRELEDRLREGAEGDADSLRVLARRDPTNVGSAVLTASVRDATPDSRSVLVRAAKILASVSGTITYR